MIIRGKRTIDNIIEFWEREKPHIIGPIQYCKFYKHAAIEVVMDFLNKNEQDIESYPWVDKIFKKRRKIFGF